MLLSACQIGAVMEVLASGSPLPAFAGHGYNFAGGNQMIYQIAVTKSDDGYSVCVPGLPGCWSQGATEAEAIENIKVALQEYLETIRAEFAEASLREIEVNA
jgi:predicted RNase H-like HicB family nuclease